MMKIEIEIPERRIRDILINAFESHASPFIIEATIAPSTDNPDDDDPYYAVLPLTEDGGLVLTDRYAYELELEPAGNWTLTRAAIRRGLRIMVEKHPGQFGNFIDETDDAITASLFLQCCVFGEEVYC